MAERLITTQNEPIKMPPQIIPNFEIIGDMPFNMERVEFALTKKQRDAIIERDGGTSQLRHYSEEKGFYKEPNCIYDGNPCPHLEVHHIKPQRTGGKDEATNLITLKACEHTGRCPSGRIKNG